MSTWRWSGGLFYVQYSTLTPLSGTQLYCPVALPVESLPYVVLLPSNFLFRYEVILRNLGFDVMATGVFAKKSVRPQHVTRRYL